MRNDFIKYIENNNICGRNNRILLAVSGGIDSTVMTHLFMSSGFSSGIAHCNFGLRGEESDLDEELVKNIASDYGIPFHSIRFPTLAYAGDKGISMEMAARELRYRWFEEIRLSQNYDLVAVAHNLNDSIETMIINLVRGTGIAGLTGMKPVSGKIIRPLLFATRDKIVQYQRSHDIRYRDDRSNNDLKIIRNKIRHLILPVMKEINPSVEASLVETASKLAGINEIVKEYAGLIGSQSSRTDGKIVKFDIGTLKPYLKNKTLVFELFRAFNITGSTITGLLNIIEGQTGGSVYTRTHMFTKNRDELWICPCGKPGRIYCEINNTGEIKNAPGIKSAEIKKISGDLIIEKEKSIANIDFEKLTFPLVIRNWEKGDFFIPLGMKNRKKLSDYFIDNKYPLTEKDKVLVLESGGNIVWIIGERIDDRYKITSATTSMLRIEADPT